MTEYLRETDYPNFDEFSDIERKYSDKQQKWRVRLNEELGFRNLFDDLNEDEWIKKLDKSKLLSDNYDTVVSLDWPHYCGGATEGCGGPSGWCYTLSGQLGGTAGRSKRAAMTDSLARNYPDLFSKIVAKEIDSLIFSEDLSYPNLRFSGSGEMHQAHLPALLCLKDRGVHLWGFSKNVKLAIDLSQYGISVLFSCDRTTPIPRLELAIKNGLGLAYTSTGVDDSPPDGTIVTFPLHRSGKVREIVAADTICPKVAQEYLEGKRARAACQLRCTRCHRPQ